MSRWTHSLPYVVCTLFKFTCSASLEPQRERERESSAENKWHLYLFSYLSASCCIQLKPSYFPMISEFVEFNTHIFFILRKSNVHMLWLASRYPIWESFVSPECVTLSSILISIHLEMFGSVNTIALKCDRIWTGMGCMCLFLFLGIQFIFLVLSVVFDLTPFNSD